eukprot:UN09459
MCAEGPLTINPPTCTDPTCETCAKPFDPFNASERLKSFADQFTKSKTTEPLLRYVERLYGKPREGLIIVLLVADHHFIDFAINWFLHARNFQHD